MAKKYIVPSLSDKCMRFLQDNLDPSNVLNIIPAAEVYGEKNLVDQCWKVIAEQTEAVVNSDAFAVIERSLLDALVERRNSLEITDIDLFKGIVKLAKKESEKRGIVADGKELRRIIGEQTIKEMHFPVMNQKEFISVLLNHKIPLFNEVTNKIQTLSSSQSCPVGLPVSRRCTPSANIIRCCRFSSIKFGWVNGSSSIDFSVDRDIQFHGVYLFGGRKSFYSVSLTLDDYFAEGPLASTEGTFSSKRHKSGEYYGFDVLFEAPIVLKRDTIYFLGAHISGPESWYGTQGQITLFESGVTFNLKDLEFSLDGTDTTEGQINELIFSLVM